MNEISLTVNGQIYAGWTAFSVKRGIRSCAGAFELQLTDAWTPGGKPWPIVPGDKCVLKMDSDIAITGYVDDVDPSYDSGQHSIRVSGRDKTADLVDSSAGTNPGEYSNVTLFSLAKTLCAPYHIGVLKQTDVGAPWTNWKVNPGETVFETLDRFAKTRSVLIYSDGIGNLILGAPSRRKAGTALVEGTETGNILRASARYSQRERFSSYSVKSQLGGWSPEVSPDTATGIIGKSTDSKIKRYRPLEIVCEASVDTAGAQKRADWESSTRRGKSQVLTITVEGFRQADGKLWLPNFLVQVKAPWLGIKNTNLLITEVDYTLDASGGSTTTLELMPAEALQVLQTKIDPHDLFDDLGIGKK